MKSLVIYDSVFGNTEKVAQAAGNALASGSTNQVVKVTAANPSLLKGLDLLVVGSPTRAFRPTEGISKFLKALPESALQGIKVAAFDTRMDVKKVDNKLLTFMAKRMGYADGALVKLLEKKGGQLAGTTEGFFVKESEGPLEDGELERAAEWAKKLLSI